MIPIDRLRSLAAAAALLGAALAVLPAAAAPRPGLPAACQFKGKIPTSAEIQACMAWSCRTLPAGAPAQAGLACGHIVASQPTVDLQLKAATCETSRLVDNQGKFSSSESIECTLAESAIAPSVTAPSPMYSAGKKPGLVPAPAPAAVPVP